MTRPGHLYSSEAKTAALRALHATARKLGMDEETRRALMERVTGKRSAAEMSAAELTACRLEMEGKTPRPWAPDPDPQVRKIYAQWAQLRRDGKAKVAKPHGFAKRMTGVDRVEWCSPEQLRQVIEGLKDWLERAPSVTANAVPLAQCANPPQGTGGEL